ncbi:MAG: hypothetical protein ACOZE5_14590 [Verrucomicrobiota bacterium]
MSAPDPIRPADTCAVCGKDVSGARGFMTLHVEGRPVPLCCPMCYQVYQENPTRYDTGQKIRDSFRDPGAGSWR